MDEFSWEDAKLDIIELKSIRKSKVNILNRILEISKNLRKKYFSLPQKLFSGNSTFNKTKEILKIQDVEEQFIYFMRNEIGTQLIYFFGEEKILGIEIQYVILNSVEKRTIKKRPGISIGIDGCFFWKNFTGYLSTKPRYIKYIDRIMQCMNIYKINIDIYASMNIMRQYNDLLERKIPTAKNMFSHHPLYCLPSQIPKNYVIFPRRPLVGLFKGEQIFFRRNIKKLFTEKELEKIGLQPKNREEYFLEKSGEKFYLEIQTEKLKIYAMHKYMDYFHENQKPINCEYILHKHAKDVALLLRIDFCEPTVRFVNRTPIREGIFLEKNNMEIFMRALNEFQIHKKIDEIILRGRRFFSNLKFIKRRSEYFLALKNNLK